MIEVFNFEQGTPEWVKVRLGIPTASCFAMAMAKGEGKTRADYMARLASEAVTGQQSGPVFSSPDLERGREQEDPARQQYGYDLEEVVDQVGFIRNGKKGCSPDGLVGSLGMIEIKSKTDHLMVECIKRVDPPPAHKAQLQGNLWVAERDWIDFVAYNPKYKLLVRRVYRDEAYIRTMSLAVNLFIEELEELIETIRPHARCAEAA